MSAHVRTGDTVTVSQTDVEGRRSRPFLPC